MAKIIPLTRGQRAVVDDEDYEALVRWKWQFVMLDRSTLRGYAARTIRLTTSMGKVYMHRAIMGAGPGTVVDHIDGDTLNNRRANLRITNRAGNARNCRPMTSVKGRPTTSAYKGIIRAVPRKDGSPRWRAYIREDGRKKYLGTFGDEVEAARAWDEAALAAYGEFARLNFPGGAE